MLAKRILTAVIGIAIAIYIINFGQWLFVVTVGILALIGWHELHHMLQKKHINLWYYWGLIGLIFLLGCAWLGNSQEIIAVLFIILISILAKTVIANNSFTMNDAAFSFIGILYIGLSFIHLLLLRFTDNSMYFSVYSASLPAGAAYMWLALIGTWANDTFAFFIGSQIGKHKLCPAISPGKTIEGSVGGLIGSILAISALGNFLDLPSVHFISIGILVGITAPLGDLVESALKRFAGVKDSGNLLPGHGGILDRFDSIMLSVPAVYYYLHAFVLR